jgi:hypothetical protein
MTDVEISEIKALVSRHDVAISQLVTSVEHLVRAQTDTNKAQLETNKKLEEISKYLAKQAVFSSRLESMDRELTDSFKRVHMRIDQVVNIQSADAGCSSVKLLHKDVESLTKDVQKLAGYTSHNRELYEDIKSTHDSMLSAATLKWTIGLVVAYSITFGTYVVKSFSSIDKVNTMLITKLDRDIDDTKVLTTLMRAIELRSKVANMPKINFNKDK